MVFANKWMSILYCFLNHEYIFGVWGVDRSRSSLGCVGGDGFMEPHKWINPTPETKYNLLPGTDLAEGAGAAGKRKKDQP